MKLPRDLSGRFLGKLLGKYGYRFSYQIGSHMRYVTDLYGEHYVTIPDHMNLRIGTLDSILRTVATHLDITKEELCKELFHEKH
jgi:predicted RNA binding protein YcfA (HicA-like mRNA interferase family)